VAKVGYVKSEKYRYPTKTTMNLIAEEQRASTLFRAILVVILVALLLAAGYIYGVEGINDKIAEKESYVASLQSQLDGYYAKLSDYAEVAANYRKYSYGYMSEQEVAIVDRIDILDVIESEIMTIAIINRVTIAGNIVAVQFTGLTLEEISNLMLKLEAHDIVSAVSVSTAGTNEKESGLTANMVITFANVDKTADEGAVK
jgi:hypothetical protein